MKQKIKDEELVCFKEEDLRRIVDNEKKAVAKAIFEEIEKLKGIPTNCQRWQELRKKWVGD